MRCTLRRNQYIHVGGKQKERKMIHLKSETKRSVEDVVCITQNKNTAQQEGKSAPNDKLWVTLQQYARLSPKGNTGSRLFTKVKPCWRGLIAGSVTNKIKYPVLYSFGKSGWRSGHQSRLPPLLQMLSVVFEGFLRALQFPPSSKSTPTSQIHLPEVLFSEVVYGSCLGAERLAGSKAFSVLFAIQHTDCDKE